MFLQLFLIRAVVLRRSHLPGCLAVKQVCVRGLGKLTEIFSFFVCLMFGWSLCSNVCKASPMVGKFRINYCCNFLFGIDLVDWRLETQMAWYYYAKISVEGPTNSS